MFSRTLLCSGIASVLLTLSPTRQTLAIDNKTSQSAQVQAVTTQSEDSEQSIVELETIEVVGVDQRSELTPEQSSLKGKALRLQQSDTLGKTLETELGVSNASFGPGVGIPVVRGLTGSRVRIMQNGIGSHDASTMSPDHAVAIEPLFAEEINIVRGPETIRSGGGAIGGIVDVKDNRIPERVPENLVGGAVESRYDTNGDGTNSAFKLDLGKDWLAMRVGGFFRSRNDTQIPGTAIDAAAMQQQFGLTNIRNATGEIPNTDSESSGGSVGASWLGDTAMAGMSVSYVDNRYGIPKGSHGLDPSHIEGLEFLPELVDLTGFEDILGPDALNPSIRIEMQQTRYDFKSEWYQPVTGIERIGFRYGLVDYKHTEIEGGLPFTTFRNNANEGRFEIDHKFFESLTGTFGAQWIDRNFSALGVETFVPVTDQSSLGFYTTQELTAADWVFKAGLRTEQSWVDPEASALKLRGSALPPTPLPEDLKYQAESAAFSAKWNVSDKAAVTLSLNRAKRSPDIQELLSLGPHLSTRSFDIGNVQLQNETANMADLGFDWKSGRVNVRGNGYYNWTDSFVYQRNTGFFYDIDNAKLLQQCVSAVECLPIYAYDQRNAIFIGYESEVKTTLLTTGLGDLSVTLFSDFVRGQFADGDKSDVPRMPPLRYGTELGFGNSVWNTALRYTRAEQQRRPGLNETNTDAYHLLTATADYQVKSVGSLEFWLFAKGANLLNQEMRSSVSFLRNYAPDPGRSFVFGLRATF